MTISVKSKPKKKVKQPFKKLDNVISAAKVYLANGIQIVPAKPKSKMLYKGWKSIECDEKNIPEIFNQDDNIAAYLGKSDLVDIDLDAPGIERIANEFLPKSGFVYGRKSNRRSHWIYNVSAPQKHKKFECKFGGDLLVIVEYRTGHHAACVPPSTHKSGELYKFEKGCAGLPSPADGHELYQLTVYVAVTYALKEVWPSSSGNRNDFAMAFSGALWRAKVPLEEAMKIVGLASELAGDEEHEERANAVKDTYAKAEEGAPVTGWPRCKELLGTENKHVLKKMRGWLGVPKNKQRGPVEDVLVSLKGLDQLNIDPPEYLIEPWLAVGSVTLIYGKPKTGKTWIALAMADALINADKFIEWDVPKKHRVLYIDGEMSLSELKERTSKLITDVDDCFHLLPSQQVYASGDPPININDPKDQKFIDEAIALSEADVIVLDTLSSLSAGREENDNSSPQLEALLDWLKRLRHGGKSVVIVHHSGHDGRHARGASRIEGMVDAIVRIDGFNVGLSSVVLERLRGMPPAIDKVDVKLVNSGDLILLERIYSSGDKNQGKVLRKLLKNTYGKQEDLAEDVGMSTGGLSNLLKSMRKKKLVHPKKRELTTKGINAAKKLAKKPK